MTSTGRTPRRRPGAGLRPALAWFAALTMVAVLAVAGLVSGPAARPAQAATAAEIEEFLARLADGAKQSWYQFGVPASVTLAQAALETGWGSSTLSSQHNNYFGIKCNRVNPSPYQSGCVDMLTTEYDANGNPYQIIDSFRTYTSVANSMLDHGHYLRTRGLYNAAFPKNEDPCQFAIEVRRGGYATDPGYATYLIGMMQQRNMFRFDWRSGVGPAPCVQTTSLTSAVLGGPVEADPLLPNTPTQVLAERAGLVLPEGEATVPTTTVPATDPVSTTPTTTAPPATVHPTTTPTGTTTSTATGTTGVGDPVVQPPGEPAADRPRPMALPATGVRIGS
ncbi:glucosaminidase domain-containing protein [Propionibacteriaceae bacterium Y1923]|uniref:glucosaminidase domain-containing protein n=1 Tax=Aestuariimicrobium sp. Y1814 TaxID=3418742 RepID=UPI003C213EE1